MSATENPTPKSANTDGYDSRKNLIKNFDAVKSLFRYKNTKLFFLRTAKMIREIVLR